MTQDPSSICTFPLLWDLGFSKPLTEKGEMRTLWATCHLGSSVAAVKRPSLKEYLSRFANQKDAKGCESPQTTRPHLLMQYSQSVPRGFLQPCILVILSDSFMHLIFPHHGMEVAPADHRPKVHWQNPW